MEEARKELLILAKQDKQPIRKPGILAAEYLRQQPVLKRWLDFRCESVNNLYRMTSTAAKSFKPDIDIRWNHYTRTHSYYSGIDLSSFTKHVDSIRANAFVEHSDDLKLVDDKVRYLENFEKAAGTVFTGWRRWIFGARTRRSWRKVPNSPRLPAVTATR